MALADNLNEKQSKKARETGATERAKSGSGAQKGEPSKKRRRLKGEAADVEGGSDHGTSVSSTRKGPTRLSMDERTAAVEIMDKEMEGYTADLTVLGPQVTAQAKHAVDELGWGVDNIVQAVAEKGLDKGYQEYAKMYKRPWQVHASGTEFASHEVIFGHNLLYQLKFNELLRMKELHVNGYFDTNKMPCCKHILHRRNDEK